MGRVFSDLKDRYARTVFAQQGGLLAAKVQFDKGQAPEARSALAWVVEHGNEAELRTVAGLRLAGLLAEDKQYEPALSALAAARAEGFEALVADRRGDVLMAQGKKAEAQAAYQAAWTAMSDKIDYRRLIEAKLTALGAPPAAAAAAASGASK